MRSYYVLTSLHIISIGIGHLQGRPHRHNRRSLFQISIIPLDRRVGLGLAGVLGARLSPHCCQNVNPTTRGAHTHRQPVSTAWPAVLEELVGCMRDACVSPIQYHDVDATLQRQAPGISATMPTTKVWLCLSDAKRHKQRAESVSCNRGHLAAIRYPPARVIDRISKSQNTWLLIWHPPHPIVFRIGVVG